MTIVQRQSPVDVGIPATRTAERDGWRVVLQYPDEGAGPFLVDLSHLPRWDVQDRAIDSYRPFAIPIPAQPGECALNGNIAVNRMNRTQASIWQLSPDGTAEPPSGEAFTDIRENTLCMAILGPGAISLSETLTRLDLADPERRVPCLIQGPFAHVPCQILLLGNRPEDEGYIFTCSRGYARDMTDTIMTAGGEFGLRPAGEERMCAWISAFKD